MTAFTNHLDALFDVGKPILGSTGLEARDNLAAALEGASGAPRLWADASAGAVAGDDLLFRSVRQTLSSPASTAAEAMIFGSVFRAVISGTVRVKGIVTAISGTANISIWKNTLPILSGSSSITADISYVAGDVIFLKLSISAGGSGTTSITGYGEVHTSAIRINGGG
ncbi:MAG: hypothetical protein ACPG61_07080 [Paracoccaceae bacterium]